MLTIDPLSIPTRDLHQYILAAVSPRPIAFASTISEDGELNLAPYSFFNAFSSNPPILVFSSNRRVENNTTKDTLHNIMATKEVVINVVTYDIVRKMAVTGVEYPSNVSEFEKAGFTPLPSEMVKPMRVKESPVQMECKVTDIITLGENGGAGHLILCNVVKLHIDERVLNEKGRIDPNKIDLVARMGGLWYLRASGASLFQLEQPVNVIPVGFDQLPEHIRHSANLTANVVGALAGLAAAPTREEVQAYVQQNTELEQLLSQHADNYNQLQFHVHRLAQKLFDEGKLHECAAALWAVG